MQRYNSTTFRYAGVALAPVATPTDVIVIQGSATKTVWVKSIKITGAATAAGTMPILAVRRADAGTVGSAVLTAVTGAECDTVDIAATAVVSTVGTANYTTVGTTAGNVASGRLQMTALATGVAAFPVIWDFAGVRKDRGIALRGTLQHLCVNLAGAALPSGGVIDYEIEIEEVAA